MNHLVYPDRFHIKKTSLRQNTYGSLGIYNIVSRSAPQPGTLLRKYVPSVFLKKKTICFGGDEYGLHDMDYCNKKDCLLFQVEVLCSVTNTMHRCPSHPSISSHKPRGNFSRSVCPQFDKHLHSPTVLLFRFLCWAQVAKRLP